MVWYWIAEYVVLQKLISPDVIQVMDMTFLEGVEGKMRTDGIRREMITAAWSFKQNENG
jgi:hypothetical protein